MQTKIVHVRRVKPSNQKHVWSDFFFSHILIATFYKVLNPNNISMFLANINLYNPTVSIRLECMYNLQDT